MARERIVDAAAQTKEAEERYDLALRPRTLDECIGQEKLLERIRIALTAAKQRGGRAGDLMGILTNLQRTDVLFIDQIHRLPAVVEEFIYPAMEDFRVDFTVDSGMHAKTINIPVLSIYFSK